MDFLDLPIAQSLCRLQRNWAMEVKFFLFRAKTRGNSPLVLAERGQGVDDFGRYSIDPAIERQSPTVAALWV
jgi:hypothetical protein